jgi:hypothetical protein
MYAFCIGILAMEKRIDSCLHFGFVFLQWKNELIHVCILYWYSGNGKMNLFMSAFGIGILEIEKRF